MTAVSVIIPYYNRDEWLRAALDSVLAQSFTDFEVIVVDDGSQEEPTFLSRARDERVKYIRLAHGGPAAARNRGIKEASGRYVAFLDADDLFLPSKLQLQIEAMEARPDIVFSHTSYQRIDSKGIELDVIRSGTFTGNVYPAILTACPIATPTVMVRAAAVREQGMQFPESMQAGEDTTLWIRIARRNEIMGLDVVLTKVRLHGRNAYLDPSVQRSAGMAILREAFREDSRFGLASRRRAYGAVHASAARMFLGRGAKREAAWSLASAIVYWPFDPPSLRLLTVLVLPEPLRSLLRRVRDVIRRR